MALGKGDRGVETNEAGEVVNVKLDAHVLDPESPEAVQVPPEAEPVRNALGDRDKSPEDIFAEAEPSEDEPSEEPAPATTEETS